MIAMKSKISSVFILLLLWTVPMQAQTTEEVVQRIVQEATENSQLKDLGHHLMDVIGPRLVGTPQQQKAHDWGVEKMKSWGIEAYNEQFGVWRGWERGITHIDMLEPRVVSLRGMQLAWSPTTGRRPNEGGLIIIPEVADSLEFVNWLPNVRGKFVMISMHQPSGRPDYNWEEWATEESFENFKAYRDSLTAAWNARMRATGHNNRQMIRALEDAGAIGIVQSLWSRGFGSNRIFGAQTRNIPHLDIQLEDYGMLYRLVESGADPKIRVRAESRSLGEMPTFNTIGVIPGTEKPDEYVMLSAHFDSWDGATGATDNGTGSITMLEVMRILKEVYPEPKRTIKVGLWGSEEQGLNGSRAFVEDNPDVVEGLQALFNQDNGTGRVVDIGGQGFLHSYEFMTRWLHAVPQDVRRHIDTDFPGMPSGGGTDHASFVTAGAPGFSLRSLSWDYWSYTWHTTLDTYDKLVWDDLKNNVILIATLAYMASEDPDFFPRDRRVMPPHPRTGEIMEWPAQREPNRRGGLDD